jgi:thiamine kinase-like enzyme
VPAPAVPAEAVRALAPVLGEPEGAPEALAGGITNRNYRLRWGGRDCVLRMPGKDTALLGIDRRAEWAATRAAAAAGIGPPAIAFDPGLGCLVTEFVEGRPVEPPELRARIPELAAALRTIHAGGALPAVFDAFAVVEQYRRIAEARGAAPPPGFGELADGARAIRAALSGPEHAPAPCHNDLLSANLIDDGRRLRILDWEYAGMGDRHFDLGNLAANNGFTEADDEALLDAYWPGGCTSRRLAALRLMRVMSDFREGMWGVVQAAVSELEFDFADYASEHLGRVAGALADPRLGTWLEDARG